MFAFRCGFLAVTFTALALLSLAEGRAAQGGLGSIEGKVTLDGQPLPVGKVTLHRADGQFFGSKIQPDGTFKLDPIRTGKYKITVEASLKGKDLVPKKFAAEELSTIQFELKEGSNTFDLSLTTAK